MKNVFLFLVLFPVFLTAQKNVALSANEISPLLIGSELPKVTIQKTDNTVVPIQELTNKKKSVIIIYRGGWCPYCNQHLKNLAQIEKDVLQLGYQILAISPDAPSSLTFTSNNEKLKYTLLSDSKGELIQALGIAFLAPEPYKPYISKGSNGANDRFLPVPAVFVIDENNKIVFEYLAPDYKHRISDKLLLSVLKNL